MKTEQSLATFIALGAFALGASAWGQEATPADETVSPPVPVYKVSPRHPIALYEQAIEGNATVVVTVDVLGNVEDPEVQNASHKEFGIAATVAASEWVFEPATKNGVPIEIRVSLPFDFKIALEHKLNVQIGRKVFVQLEESVLPSSDLSQEPLPSFVPPFSNFYPESLRGSGKSASISLEFVISPEGEVLNPRVLSSSSEGFEEAALLAASHMTYRPIEVDGNPVYVSVIRPFQLSE